MASGENNVIDWDENQFDHVANESHDEETHDARLQDLHVLLLVWLLALLVEDDRVLDEVLYLLGGAWLLFLVGVGWHFFSLFLCASMTLSFYFKIK